MSGRGRGGRPYGRGGDRAGGAYGGRGRGGGRSRSILHTGAGGAGGGDFGGRSLLRHDAARKREEEAVFDASMGFERLESGGERIGYLFNMLPTVLVTPDDRAEHAALDMYFIQQVRSNFCRRFGVVGVTKSVRSVPCLCALALRVCWLPSQHTLVLRVPCKRRSDHVPFFPRCIGSQDGETFKGTIVYQPYFYVALAGSGSGMMPSFGRAADAAEAEQREVVSVLEKKFEGLLAGVTAVEKEDLEMINHLSGAWGPLQVNVPTSRPLLVVHRKTMPAPRDSRDAMHLTRAGRRRTYLRLAFKTVNDLNAVRSELRPIVERNARAVVRATAMGGGVMGTGGGGSSSDRRDPLRLLIDIREYDVTYYSRVSIDLGVRVGAWYRVAPSRGGVVTVSKMDKDFVVTAEPRVLAWDIETTKAPLKFPDAQLDMVYMISYMLDGQVRCKACALRV